MNNDKEETMPDPNREKIQGQLSTMSFEELLKLKEEMGTKLYGEAISGETVSRTAKQSFKRANKNRPREISSKKVFRVTCDVVPVTKPIVARDPRFESICGTFDKKIFKNNYKFVNDIRKKEKKQLENELQNTSAADEKKRIKLLLQRLENQIREDEKERRQQDSSETQVFSKEEKKMPFKKKSVAKLESLINKFEELKKTNKVHKHIERKSKKIFARERRNLKKQQLM